MAGRPRRPGIRIDPDKLRKARLERGFSMAQLAGSEISRAFIHQIEHGISRPSLEVLQFIAARTGKPVEYFTGGKHHGVIGGVQELPDELRLLANRLRRYTTERALTEPEARALKLMESSLRDGAKLLEAIETELQPSPGES